MATTLPTPLIEIEAVIRRLGVSGSYSGLPHLVRAVALVLDRPDATQAVVKEIYTPVAKAAAVKPASVEHTIRTVRDQIWYHGNRELLDEMAGYHLRQPPTVSALIDYIAHYMRR